MSEQLVEAAFGEEPKQQSLVQEIGRLAQKAEDIANAMKEAKDEDTARYQALKEEQIATSATLTELKAKHDADVRAAEVDSAIAAAAEWRKQLGNMREPSKAGVIAAGNGGQSNAYQQGDFLYAVALSRSRDAEDQAKGKAMLADLKAKSQLTWGEPTGKATIGQTTHESWGKSTIGSTDATGGWIIPNAVVDEFIAPAQVTNIYRGLMTVVPGVTAAAVDLPFRSGVRASAAVIAFGQTKTNTDLAYNGYTATMYTLAVIYDIGNQFLRQSRGAAEADVLSELAAAFAQGESDYIREGTGSSQPFGYTSALTNGPATFRTANPGTLSDSTLVGSIARNIAAAAGALAGRGVVPTAGVLSATAYWQMLAQGSDTAGFWFSTVANSPAGIRPQTLISPFGIPIYPDADADLKATSAVTDNLVLADWKKFKLFFGQDYRVDQSDQAGSRWDTNLTGFRGEEEMGFDARPAVYAGYAQMVLDVIP